MGHKYAEVAFTPQVKALQEEYGSRPSYERMEAGEDFNDRLGENEVSFIAARDSFYIASVSETGWPYVQHRGGPPGFVRVIDKKTIGFADFRGNKQYISTGNLMHDDRVSLFFMDYPNQARLKLLGHVEIVDKQDASALKPPGYRAIVERGFVIQVVAFDWNCPQHITPRYTEAEFEALQAASSSE